MGNCFLHPCHARLYVQVGDLLIAFCKDFAMSYERLLRAVAVIVADKAELDDILLKVSQFGAYSRWD